MRLTANGLNGQFNILGGAGFAHQENPDLGVRKTLGIKGKGFYLNRFRHLQKHLVNKKQQDFLQ